jgi:hypothetical protein
MPEHRSKPRYRNLDAALFLILTFAHARAARWSNGWLSSLHIQSACRHLNFDFFSVASSINRPRRHTRRMLREIMDIHRKKALRAYELVKEYSLMLTRYNYTKLKEGSRFVASHLTDIDRCRDARMLRHDPAIAHQLHHLYTRKLEDVLSVVFHKKGDGRWGYDMILENDHGHLIFGSPEEMSGGAACYTHEEAVERACSMLSIIGHPPAGHQPPSEPPKRTARFFGRRCLLPEMPEDRLEEFMGGLVSVLMEESGRDTITGIEAERRVAESALEIWNRSAGRELTEREQCTLFALATVLAQFGWHNVCEDTLREYLS